MKKQQLDHVLRAAGRITGEKQFIVIGSQSLHAKHADLPDELVTSFEVDLIAKNDPGRTELLNTIGVDSPFHETFGYYADPVDESTAVLPKGWKGRTREPSSWRYGRRSRALSRSARFGHREIRGPTHEGSRLHARTCKTRSRESKALA